MSEPERGARPAMSLGCSSVRTAICVLALAGLLLVLAGPAAAVCCAAEANSLSDADDTPDPGSILETAATPPEHRPFPPSFESLRTPEVDEPARPDFRHFPASLLRAPPTV